MTYRLRPTGTPTAPSLTALDGDTFVWLESCPGYGVTSEGRVWRGFALGRNPPSWVAVEASGLVAIYGERGRRHRVRHVHLVAEAFPGFESKPKRAAKAMPHLSPNRPEAETPAQESLFGEPFRWLKDYPGYGVTARGRVWRSFSFNKGPKQYRSPRWEPLSRAPHAELWGVSLRVADGGDSRARKRVAVVYLVSSAFNLPVTHIDSRELHKHVEDILQRACQMECDLFPPARSAE